MKVEKLQHRLSRKTVTHAVIAASALLCSHTRMSLICFHILHNSQRHLVVPVGQIAHV